MNGHEKKTVKQGLNLPVSRFNFLLFHSQCSNNQVSWFKHGLDDDFHINAV